MYTPKGKTHTAEPKGDKHHDRENRPPDREHESPDLRTFGVEVEGNNITRQNAARVAAEYFGTGRYEYTASRNGYMTWSAWDGQGREWKFHYSSSVVIQGKIPEPSRFRDF